MKHTDVLVIGGGAAGMMAARTAAKAGAEVVLLERNPKLGRKLYITGKGRCNLTNNCCAQEVLNHIAYNSRFLTGVMHRTAPEKVMELFEQLGVPLKTERGNRVFPKSDRAADVIDALVTELRRCHVSLVQDRAVRICGDDGHITAVEGERGTYLCRTAILATGGASYPLTGSTGDGYRMAAQLGHTVIPPRPSLIPLETQEEFCAQMQGLSLRNVSLKIKTAEGKLVFQEQGEMLFTHFGISGPLVLSASACMREFDTQRYIAVIDLKPALDEQTLDARLVREFSERSNQELQHSLGGLVPRRMIPTILAQSGVPGATKGHDLSRQQRRRILETLKGLTIHITRPRPLEEAIITAGGIDVKELNAKTMMSKKLAGLFFAGEVIDVDAYTGGYNLQIAWATGVAAGASAAEYCKVK